MKRWWLGLQQRERIAVLWGGAALAVLLAWAFIWYPLSRSRNELHRQVSEQHEALVTMRNQAAEVKALRAQGAQSQTGRQGKSLLALADSSARSAGLTGALRHVEPLSERSVRVSFEAASFDSLMTWLESLARDFGVQATDFSADRADGVGVVNVRVTLEDR